jgi:hypothetical protein
MAQEEGIRRCEVCGARGTLVEFGDERAYRYHCLTCWLQVAERVVVEYVERLAPAAGRRSTGG